MRKFIIRIWRNLSVYYGHYLSDKLIKEKGYYGGFKKLYPLGYSSRGFDKPAIKWRDGACIWYLDNKRHRVRRPAAIWSDGSVSYWENGEWIK